MKLTALLLLTTFMGVFASESYSQTARLSLKAEQISLEDFLIKIEKQSEFRFFYTGEINIDKKVSGEFKEQKINDILDIISEEADIKYEVMGRQIILSPKNSKTSIKSIQAQKSVSGIVTDASGTPMPGVTIVIKGTSDGTVTDIDGNYSLTNVPENAQLVFSFVGMKAQEITVAGKTRIDVTLEANVIGLEEVVAVGYGTMKKADLTGSVSSVKGTELEKVSSTSVATAIAGKLPGLQVTQTSGEPGAASVIRMRGVGSVYSGIDPLVLIDGFPGDLSQISSSDVESISVLKDAASASIYGSRAANGVILVTTKTGKNNQELKVELNAKIGIQRPTNIPDILDSQEWARKMNESTMARSGVEHWTGENAPENQTVNTNWLDYIFRTDAPVQDYNISASGGAKNLRYAVNIGYYDQDGIMINQNYNKYNIRSSIDYANDRFSAGVKLYKLHTTNTSDINYTSTVMYDAFRTPATIPVYNADGLPGTPRESAPGEDVLKDRTPSMDAILREYEGTANYSVTNLYAEVKLIEGLRFKTIFNYKTTDSYSEEFFPVWSTYRPDDVDHETVFMGNTKASLTAASSTSSVWESQNILTYKKDIGKHHIDLLAGYSAQKSKASNLSATGANFLRNSLKALNAAGEKVDIAGVTAEGTITSQFGRINYSFAGKYLAQFNLRRDGSSVFAPGNRWSTFPSASLGWRISEEEFMKSVVFIDNMKLRAGIGSLGNANIPAGQWYSKVSFGSGYVFGVSQDLYDGSQIGAYNEDISWEKTTTYNLGLDMTMLKNKLNLSAELYKRKTTDMLLVMPLPQTTGYSTKPYVNLGGVDNTGWEFNGQYADNVGSDFSYSVGFNITHVKNEVVDMGGLAPIIDRYTRTEEGQAVNSYYGYIVEGIYQSEEEIANSPSYEGAKPGDLKYKNLNDEDDIINEDDKTYLGNAIPKFFYGGNISAAYKSFDLSMFFQGEANKKIMVVPAHGMDFGASYDYANMYKEVYDNRWTKEGDNTRYPALGSGQRTINTQTSTTWLHNASYLRLKNIQLGYTLPKALTSKAGIGNARVFVNATNLLTFTDYIGFDPEMGTRQKREDGTQGMYMDKVYTYGGCDYPQAKTFEIGINVNF